MICRFAVNTSFLIENKQIFNKKTVDPDSIAKNNAYSDKFKVEIHFEDVCNMCHST